MNIVHSGIGKLFQYLLNDPPSDVWLAHGRQGQRDVVEGNGHLHTRAQAGGEGLRTYGVLQGLLNGSVHVANGMEGRWRVHHPRTERQSLIAEALAVVKEIAATGVLHVGDQLFFVDFHGSDVEGA